MSPVRYELDSYILEDCILHSHSHEHLKSYIHFRIFQYAVPVNRYCPESIGITCVCIAVVHSISP
jgi:hypothetical protein